MDQLIFVVLPPNDSRAIVTKKFLVCEKNQGKKEFCHVLMIGDPVNTWPVWDYTV